MRYWLKRSIYTSDWEYAVEYYGITNQFTRLEALREFRERLAGSRSELIIKTLNIPFRNFITTRTVHFTMYHFNSRMSALRFFWQQSYIHLRYHPQITHLLDEAYETFKKGQTK